MDKVILCVHVIFNEIIPNPTVEYFAELERLKIEVAKQSEDPADIQCLVGIQHWMMRTNKCMRRHE